MTGFKDGPSSTVEVLATQRSQLKDRWLMLFLLCMALVGSYYCYGTCTGWPALRRCCCPSIDKSVEARAL